MSVASALSRAFAIERAPRVGVWLPVLLVVLAAAIPWAWAPAGYVVAGIDTPPNVDFDVLWKTTLHTWDPAPNGGISNFVGYGMFFPYYIVASHLQALGVSPHAITLGALSFAFALGTLGFYIFTRQLGASPPVRALLTLGYTLNLGHTFMAPGAPALFAYAALPWMPLAAVCAANKPLLRQIAIGLGFAIVSTGLVFLKINPPTYVALFIGGIVLALLALRARALRVPVAMAVAFAGAFLVLNLWWIADFLLGVHIDPASVTVGLSLQTVEGVSAGSTLAQILLLGGSWAFDPRYDANPYFAYAEWYRSGGVQFLLALAPACTLAALVLYRNLRAAMWTLAAILLFVFLDAGYHPPFGWAFLWMFQHVPFFWLYREPLTKFDGILAVVYVCAFGFLIPQIANVYQRRVVTGLLVLATVGFITGGLPFAGGAVVRPAIADSPSFKVRVPAYWLNFGKWANAQDGGRIAMLPQNAHYELLYDWGYLGADVDGMLLRHPFIDITPSAGYTDAGMKDVEMEWYDSLARAGNSVRRTRFLSDALDIQYVVVRHDVKPTLLSPMFTPESTYLPKLRAIGFHRVRQFGELDVYERQCCAQVAKAELRPVPLVYADALPVHGWYSLRYNDAIYAPSQAFPNGSAARWLPTSNFVFGVAGIQTRDRVGVRMWSALGSLDQAQFTRARGQTYFVAIGELLAPLADGRVYRWHSSVGSFEGEGHLIAATPVETRSAEGLLTLPATSVQQYGLLMVHPLAGACNIVTVDGAADPAHLVLGHNEGLVVQPYGREYTARVLLNGENTITVTPCGSNSASNSAYTVTAYAIADEQPFVLHARPQFVPSALQSGTRSLALNRKADDAECHCTLSYGVLPLRAPDLLDVQLPPSQTKRTIRFGVLDASGTPRFSSSEENKPAVGAGKVVIACACAGDEPTVNVGLGAAQSQRLARIGRAAAAVHVAESSETGSEGDYDASSPSAAVLPQSYSNGWQLRVDGRVLPHLTTVTRQNAWLLPPGHHRYRLSFWLEDLGAKLQLLAEIAAAAFFAAIVVIAVVTLRRTA